MLKLLFLQTNKLKQLDQLIRLKCTGNPETLAYKLGISKRHVNNYINTLEDLGAEISYNRARETYMYQSKYKLNIEISLINIDKANSKNYNGGMIELPRSIFSKCGFEFFSQTYLFPI